MFDNFYFVLTMKEHGLVAREREMNGVLVPRYLNAVGRWAGNGKRVPILVWTVQQKAIEAAQIATVARKRPVTVTLIGGSVWTLEKTIRVFTEADSHALSSYIDRP
jgi:hypothetical protein